MLSFNDLRSAVARHDVNRKGWKTNRKIVVIESDDWGAIRMPNASVYKEMLKMGYDVDKCPYARNDSLASEQDLDKLFEVLLSFKDSNGNPPVITANCVTANPVFARIQDSGYQQYFWEPITETFKRYDFHQKAFDLWKLGIEQKVFVPQFHGREHVNHTYWLRELQHPESDYRRIFPFETWTINAVGTRGGKINLQAALDTETIADLDHQRDYLSTGAQLFEKLFGYKSASYIATNFIIHTALFETLSQHGVEIIQGMKYQKMPILSNAKRQLIKHYTGEVNDAGQLFLVRNCVFEPSQKPQNFDSVGECLKDIKNAFFWKKPAIITAHRLNFTGYINPANREVNLKRLNELLSGILKKWPDVEFMTSPELGALIKKNGLY